MQDKYGFVYVWYDRKHKRYYVGSHWGREDDGYVCSSSWMKSAHKRRPEDFRRRILKKVHTNRAALLEEEHKWLQMIKDEELGKRFYNLKNKCSGHWSTDETKRQKMIELHSSRIISKETRQKMSLSHLGKTQSEETRRKKSLSLIGKNVGKKMNFETKEKLRNANLGKTISEEARKLISSALSGRKLSEETKRKISMTKRNKRGTS